MKKLLILLTLSVLIWACGGDDNQSKTASQTSTPKTTAPKTKPINAAKIWKVRCIACHGLYGDMGTNGAANLQEVTTPLEERINIITNGSENGVMTPFGDILSEKEIKAVAKYTMTFNKDL